VTTRPRCPIFGLTVRCSFWSETGSH